VTLKQAGSAASGADIQRAPSIRSASALIYTSCGVRTA
jgi:hypothetical protein